MRLTKSRPKNELELVKELCKAQNIDYDNIELKAEYDTAGNIISIETDNTVLDTILRSRGFSNVP